MRGQHLVRLAAVALPPAVDFEAQHVVALGDGQIGAEALAESDQGIPIAEEVGWNSRPPEARNREPDQHCKAHGRTAEQQRTSAIECDPGDAAGRQTHTRDQQKAFFESPKRQTRKAYQQGAENAPQGVECCHPARARSGLGYFPYY